MYNSFLGTVSDKTKATIICVDDEPIILTSLGEQLKRALGQQYDLELIDRATWYRQLSGCFRQRN